MIDFSNIGRFFVVLGLIVAAIGPVWHRLLITLFFRYIPHAAVAASFAPIRGLLPSAPFVLAPDP